MGSVGFLTMFSDFLCRRVSAAQVSLLIICIKLIRSAQPTSPALTRTQHTLQLSHSASCRNDFLFAADLESFLSVYKVDLAQDGTDWYTCDGSLSVPAGKFLSLRVNKIKPEFCTDKVITFKFTFNSKVTVRPCLGHTVAYHAEQRTVQYSFAFSQAAPTFSMTVIIRALDKDRKNNLYVSYQTHFSGTVTPYGFDGFADYAVDMMAIARLYPPAGHSVMVSIPHFHLRYSHRCRADVLDAYVNKRWIWGRCGEYQIPPAVYSGNLTFLFKSENNTRGFYSGFKVRFSFHGASQLPDKLLTTNLNTAVFNCSVPFYSKFSQHLDCNLETECAQAEDEANCPYSRGACEPGYLNAGGKCYKYIKVHYKRITWYDAFLLCHKQGLTLASFSKTSQEIFFRNNVLHFAFNLQNILFGLRTSDTSLPPIYREVLQWSSGSMAYNARIVDQRTFKPFCAVLEWRMKHSIKLIPCGDYVQTLYFFCELETPIKFNSSRKFKLLPRAVDLGDKENTRFVTCSEGHLTWDFLSCDYASRCGAEPGVLPCVTYESSKLDKPRRDIAVSMFICDSQTQTIHYTQVCDHQAQCFDSSDETFCIYRACSEKQCKNQQCVTAGQWCDGMAHCSDGSDEHCPQFLDMSETSSALISGFYVVLLDGHGNYEYVPQGERFPVCPPTHFLCADRQLCLPVYLQCNNVYDCSDREDEDNCDDVTCPGFYRCRGSAVCVHSDHICDGVFHCPEQDDELLCEQSCPDNCLCQGLAFVCPRPFPVQAYSDLRYLDASESGLTPDKLFHNHYLIRLVLSSCRLYTLPVLQFPNLQFLNLGTNRFSNLTMHVFLKLLNLNFLSLARNPVVSFVAVEANVFLHRLHSLDLSHTKLSYFESRVFCNLRNLTSLNMSHSTLTFISNSGFGALTHIETLDLRGTKLEDYPITMLHSLSSLQVLFSDIYKLCCPEVLPEQFNTKNCHALLDEIASCKDLLRSIIYRMFLWISCFFALIGNVGNFAARFYTEKGKPRNSMDVFVANLNIANFFMGLYLAVIGSADQVYRSTYLWHDDWWRKSAGCQMAGFLSLLSCEMSAFILFFITLDRFLVIRFPSSQLRFRDTSAVLICGCSWMIGFILAVVPLVPVTSHWERYSQTAICIPLPITRQNFSGHFYTFGILFVFNLSLFVFIAVGQLMIYMSIHGTSVATDKKTDCDVKLAQRLLTIVSSDFLCWFPVGLLGLLSSGGVSVLGEVNVAIAIFALPLNSALNPFLYMFNLMKEKRRKALEQRLLQILQTRRTG